MREANERLLLNIIRQNPQISRSDMARITGFSPSSITLIVNRLMRRGLLSEERREGPAPYGRRPVALRLRPDALIAVGVEISRPHSRVVTADLHGKLLQQKRVPWHANPEVLLSRIRNALRILIDGLSDDQSLLGVGVGVPGTIDRSSGTVIAAENLGWFDVPVGAILSEGTSTSFNYENNAKLAALAERWFCEPAASPPRNFVFVTMHHGLGTGVIADGKVLLGASGAAAEFGHVILYPDGRQCVCGNTGCWEEYASDRALERLYAERRGAECVDPRPDAEEIVRMARSGDAVALGVLQETAAFVGMGFANLNAVLNPEAIVVGNYLASGWDLMKDWVWEALRNRAPQRYLTRLRIVPATFGADSTLMGALALVLSRFFTEFDNSRKHGPPNSAAR
jgi:predicted NBD/HSP70 family sugar kinase